MLKCCDCLAGDLIKAVIFFSAILRRVSCGLSRPLSLLNPGLRVALPSSVGWLIIILRVCHKPLDGSANLATYSPKINQSQGSKCCLSTCRLQAILAGDRLKILMLSLVTGKKTLS